MNVMYDFIHKHICESNVYIYLYKIILQEHGQEFNNFLFHISIYLYVEREEFYIYSHNGFKKNLLSI